MRHLRRWVILGVLAFAVGTLFRLAEETGVGLFRMFGTMGIGLSGGVAAFTLTRMQQESARTDLHERISSIPDTKAYTVPPELRARAVESVGLLERNDDLYLIATSSAPNFRGRRHGRRVKSEVLRLAQCGTGTGEGQLGRILVLLRRSVREDEQNFATAHGVVIANPDTIGPGLLSSARQIATAL